MNTQNKPATALSFCPSADCELSRWVLQYHGVTYVEKRHAPPFFFLINKWYGGSSYILYKDNGKSLDGARQIIDHFESIADAGNKLIPEAYASDIEAKWKDFNAGLGGEVVTWAYSNLLPHKAIMIRPLSWGSPWFERIFTKYFYGLSRDLMWKTLKLDKAAADEALIAIKKRFSEVDGLLADGRKYLYGDRMTLADLAFVVSGAPLVLPDNYGGYKHEQGPIPTFEQFPKELQKTISEMRQTPAGKYILRLYAEERYR